MSRVLRQLCIATGVLAALVCSAAQADDAAKLRSVSCLQGLLKLEVPAAWGELHEQRSIGQLTPDISSDGMCFQMSAGNMPWMATVQTYTFASKSKTKTISDVAHDLENSGKYSDVEILDGGRLLYRWSPEPERPDDRTWTLCAVQSEAVQRCATFRFKVENEALVGRVMRNTRVKAP